MLYLGCQRLLLIIVQSVDLAADHELKHKQLSPIRRSVVWGACVPVQDLAKV